MFGFSAHLSPTHRKSLNQIDGFLRPIPENSYNSTPHFLRLSRGKGLWGESNLASDVIIQNGSSLYRGKPKKQLFLVYGKSAANNGTERFAQLCIRGSLDPKLVKGKMVACERGINGRTQKGEVVKTAGGVGMILLNSASNGEELFADAHIIQATSLGASASKTIRSYVLTDKNPTASISFIGTVYGDSKAPTMASFSSRGPSLIGPDVIKPVLTAPDVNILAAWPPKTSPSLLKSDKRSVLFNLSLWYINVLSSCKWTSSFG